MMDRLLLIVCCLFASLAYANEVDPYVLRREALTDLKNGEAGVAQTKLIAAYELFVESENWDMASMCLYERAIEYMNIGDFANMLQQVDNLRWLDEHYPSALTAYNYHSVISAYYVQVDSAALAIAHGENSIRAVEQIANPRAYNIMPVWNYYNQALMYDLYSDPRQTDSITYYLRKARHEIATASPRPQDSIEALISVVDLEAWAAYSEADYREAEELMLEVIAMIDTVAQLYPNTIITERGEAYKFMAMIYEEQGKWRQALDYQQKVTENNELRYDVDKRRVLQEVQTQYEVEKQQLEMEKLEAENRSSRWLIVALWLLLVVLVIGYWLLVMGRRNTEAKLYEAALEADSMRHAISELESQTDVEPLRLLANGLVEQLQARRMEEHAQRIEALDFGSIQALVAQGTKITTMDKRYILCFAAGMTVEQIADFMNLEPASVYTVRYRLRKKFASKQVFPY